MESTSNGDIERIQIEDGGVKESVKREATIIWEIEK